MYLYNNYEWMTLCNYMGIYNIKFISVRATLREQTAQAPQYCSVILHLCSVIRRIVYILAATLFKIWGNIGIRKTGCLSLPLSGRTPMAVVETQWTTQKTSEHFPLAIVHSH
jgi:hypothetical protein